VLVNRFSFGRPLDDAVASPRLHVEGDRADIEPGFDEETPRRVGTLGVEPVLWDQPNMFFGGVHAVERSASGAVAAAADPRRDGASLVL
jgi:gamma-glutamyltranspeptidase/glutathione hydrolase